MGAGVGGVDAVVANCNTTPRAKGSQLEHNIQAPVLDTGSHPPVWNLAGKIGGMGVSVAPKMVGEKEVVPKREKSVSEWNTKNLGSRLAVDAACAASAGGVVAPVIAMIDRAIIENASGKRPLLTSVKASLSTLLLRPHQFLSSRPFLLIFMVYGGTYLTANTLDTTTSTIKNRPAASTTSGYSKFVATSAANLNLGIYKDSQLTKMFGTVSARPLPPASYALFAVRDCLTIFASFNIPPLLAPRIPLSESAQKYISATSTAQFVAPAAIQLVSTPFHLLGLDLYNRNGDTTMRDRVQKVRLDWFKSSVARMCRIVPAFGFGGVINNGMRRRFMSHLE